MPNEESNIKFDPKSIPGSVKVTNNGVAVCVIASSRHNTNGKIKKGDRLVLPLDGSSEQGRELGKVTPGTYESVKKQVLTILER